MNEETMPGQVKRQPEISETIQELEQSIMNMQESMLVLTDRLKPIMNIPQYEKEINSVKDISEKIRITDVGRLLQSSINRIHVLQLTVSLLAQQIEI